MQNIYLSFEVEAPAGQEKVVEVITGREGALPYFTSVGRELILDEDFILYVNDVLVIDVPWTMKMGFDNFLPWYHQLKVGDVVRAGLRNKSTTTGLLRFTVCFFYAE